MGSNFSKIKALLRTGLALCSLMNLVWIYIYAGEILLKGGPFPERIALQYKENSLIGVTGFINGFLPYWWGDNPATTMGFHFILLVFFVWNRFPRFVIPMLLIFEYCLLVRLGPMVHGGHILYTYLLFFIGLENWLSEKRKWISSALIVSQLSLVYLFSGIYKDLELWLFSGRALKDFMYLESTQMSLTPMSLGTLGTWLSRLVIPVEILGATVIIVDFLKGIRKSWVIIALLFLAGIHIGSLILFSIFTFPILGLLFLMAIYIGLVECKMVFFRKKIIIFLIVLVFHLVPFFGIQISPFKFFPLWNKWTFFSKLPPRVKGGGVEIMAKIDDEVVHLRKLNESFHWTRYRYMVADSWINYSEIRSAMNDYLCTHYEATEITWRHPTDVFETHRCSHHSVVK